MSYVLPSCKFDILISPILANNPKATTEHNHKSYTQYHNTLRNNYNNFLKKNEICEKYKIIESCNYLYETPFHHEKSISELKYKHPDYYEVIEIISKLKLNTKLKSNINENNLLIISNYYQDIEDAFKSAFESYNSSFETLDERSVKIIKERTYDVMFFDATTSSSLNILQMLMIVLQLKKQNGLCMIKLHLHFIDSIQEYVYFLSYLFENVLIMNAESSRNEHIYIICEDYIVNNKRIMCYNKNFVMLFFLFNELNNPNKHITSLFTFKIPYFFQTKLDNIINIIVQQNIETFYNLCNYLYINNNYGISSKNESDILTLINNINNQKIKKAHSWCKKYIHNFQIGA